MIQNQIKGMKNTANTYTASFTAGALFREECKVLIPLLLAGDEEAIRNEKETGAQLRINARASRLRTIREVRNRFEATPKAVWERYTETSDKTEQALLLLFAALKTYTVLHDFQVEVVAPRWQRYNRELSKTDFLSFLYRKSEEHPEIDDWSQSTQEKLATVTIRMLAEAGLLQDGKLKEVTVPFSFWVFFMEIDEPWFLDAVLLPEDLKQRIGYQTV